MQYPKWCWRGRASRDRLDHEGTTLMNRVVMKEAGEMPVHLLQCGLRKSLICKTLIGHWVSSSSSWMFLSQNCESWTSVHQLYSQRYFVIGIQKDKVCLLRISNKYWQMWHPNYFKLRSQSMFSGYFCKCICYFSCSYDKNLTSSLREGRFERGNPWCQRVSVHQDRVGH